MSSPMHQDFLDLLRAFVDRDLRFLIVGAYALAMHGHTRERPAIPIGL